MKGNYIMDNTFFIGVYPGLGEPELNFIIETIGQYTNKELSIKYNLSGTTIKYHKRKIK